MDPLSYWSQYEEKQKSISENTKLNGNRKKRKNMVVVWNTNNKWAYSTPCNPNKEEKVQMEEKLKGDRKGKELRKSRLPRGISVFLLTEGV